MNRKLLAGMVFGSLLSTGVASPAWAGTSTLDLKVKSTIEVGTCTAAIYDGTTKTNTIALGNVPVSQVVNYQSNAGKAFKIRFSDCSGLPNGKANLKIVKRANGCAGGNSNQAGFANSTAAASGGATATALELWTGSSAGQEPQFHCYTPDTTTQEINVSAATGSTTVDYDMSARLAMPSGKSLADIQAGSFLGETTFIISYN